MAVSLEAQRLFWKARSPVPNTCWSERITLSWGAANIQLRLSRERIVLSLGSRTEVNNWAEEVANVSSIPAYGYQ
jgi:hypothetical protein